MMSPGHVNRDACDHGGQITADEAVLSIFAPIFFADTIRQTPNTPQKWVCNVPGCNKTFQRADRAVAHENLHKGIYPYKCEGTKDHEECSRAFVSKELRRSHYDRDDAKCRQCNLVIRKRNMARHVRECHQGGAMRR